MQAQRSGGKTVTQGSMKSRPSYGRAQGRSLPGELDTQCLRSGKSKSTFFDTGSWIWIEVTICVKTLLNSLIQALRHVIFAKTIEIRSFMDVYINLNIIFLIIYLMCTKFIYLNYDIFKSGRGYFSYKCSSELYCCTWMVQHQTDREMKFLDFRRSKSMWELSQGCQLQLSGRIVFPAASQDGFSQSEPFISCVQLEKCNKRNLFEVIFGVKTEACKQGTTRKILISVIFGV